MTKWLGSVLLIIGTSIGAAMLALPIIAGSIGFVQTLFLLIGIWVTMTLTGIMVWRLASLLPDHSNSFSSMASLTLGKGGQILTWLCYLLLLYSLTGAYISGDSSIVSMACQFAFKTSLPSFINDLLFVVIFGGVVFYSTQAVDVLNRGLMSIKFCMLFLMIFLLMPQIHFNYLTQSPSHSLIKVFSAIPILLTAFGYHTVLPTLCTHLGDRKKYLGIAIVAGTLIPLIIYILWLTSTMGVLPLHGHMSFAEVQHSQNQVQTFISSLNQMHRSMYLNLAINSFSTIAITTSFLGVSIGLFDFIADAFKRSNSLYGRAQTALITFLPPLIFSWIYPNGFMLALGFAGIIVTILEVILPAVMITREQKINPQISHNFLFYLAPIVTICGSALLILEIYLKF